MFNEINNNCVFIIINKCYILKYGVLSVLKINKYLQF